MILINLKKNELLYDIEYTCYKVAKIHFLPNAPQSAADVAVAEDDRDYIDRLLHDALTSVEDTLQWCVEKRQRSVASDAISPERQEYDIELNINDQARRTMADALCSAIHNFVVHSVVYHFLLVSATDLAPSYAALAESDLNRAYNLCRNNSKYKFYSWM